MAETIMAMLIARASVEISMISPFGFILPSFRLFNAANPVLVASWLKVFCHPGMG